MNTQHKAGIVAIIGRPSCGKSTFLNTIIGEKVSIVSNIPQTTRNAIRGIVNDERGQIVFIDTPGYHQSEKKLNLKLGGLAREQLDSADAILYIIDTSRSAGEEEQLIVNLIRPYYKKTIIAINKIDNPIANVALTKTFLIDQFGQNVLQSVFEISAKENTGINYVQHALFNIIPEGEAFYPTDYYTDQEVEFRIAEIIREEAIARLQQEIPHALFVEIADTEWRKTGKLLWVRGFIVVERESQKGMVIGKGANLIKTIRVESIKALRKVFNYRIDLDLQVKVQKNWRQKDIILKKLIER